MALVVVARAHETERRAGAEVGREDPGRVLERARRRRILDARVERAGAGGDLREDVEPRREVPACLDRHGEPMHRELRREATGARACASRRPSRGRPRWRACPSCRMHTTRRATSARGRHSSANVSNARIADVADAEAEAEAEVVVARRAWRGGSGGLGTTRAPRRVRVREGPSGSGARERERARRAERRGRRLGRARQPAPRLCERERRDGEEDERRGAVRVPGFMISRPSSRRP